MVKKKRLDVAHDVHMGYGQLTLVLIVLTQEVRVAQVVVAILGYRSGYETLASCYSWEDMGEWNIWTHSTGSLNRMYRTCFGRG